MNEVTRTSVTVFGSSQALRDSPHYVLAGDLGQALGARGAEVRCGGYGGVMEAVAEGVKAGGGSVVGCTLAWFRETREPYEKLDRIEEASDLHARIDCMLRGARAAVVLPGGVGTMNELFWVWTLLLHDRDDGPEALILLGDPWRELLDTLSRRFEFPDPIRQLVRVAESAEEAAAIACGEREGSPRIGQDPVNLEDLHRVRPRESPRQAVEDVIRAGHCDDAEFDRLALALAKTQLSRIEPWRSYAAHSGISPDALTDWRSVPPVPSSAFKSHDLSAAAPADRDGGSDSTGVVFETSGTSISKPGRVRLGSTELYERSLLRSFERYLLPDGARLPAVVFGPRRSEAPRSSLWFMVDIVAGRLARDPTWVVQDGAPRWDIANAALGKAVSAGEPVMLLGTTLFFMAYFERLAASGKRFELPAGSRAMDTGGSKGQRSALARDEVERAFERALGIPGTHLVNEYGMAEMGSQFYDDTLAAFHEGRTPLPGKRIPPWVRTRVLDPETMLDLPDGERGILVHADLANEDTPFLIQTEDIGTRVGDRLLLEGRLLGAEARGCSLAFEQFLETERKR